MSTDFEQLVEQLEAIALDTLLADPDGLREAMEERQNVLLALQQADTSALDPALRGALKERLSAVQARDQALVPVLVELLEETRKAMAQAHTSRRALNGYKSLVSDAPPPVRRIG